MSQSPTLFEPPRRLQVEADVELAVHCAGPLDAPRVLLVHGYPDNHEVWQGVAAELAKSFRILCYDVRGAGGSSRPSKTSRYALPRLAADLFAVARAFGDGKPVHLVGHDWGSIQSWEAVVSPEAAALLKSFTSISGPSLDHVGASLRSQSLSPSELGSSLQQSLASWYVAAFHLPGAEKLVPKLLAKSGHKWGLDPEREGSTLQQDASSGVALYRANMSQRLLRPEPRAARVPVLQLVLADDEFVKPRMATAAEPYAAPLYRRTLRGTHWALRSEPARFARAIAEFVHAVERDEHTQRLRRYDVHERDRFAGRLAVITGAASGIGRATAFALAARHARLLLLDRDAAGLAEVHARCEALGAESHFEALDVQDRAAVFDCVARHHEALGAADCLILSAGIGLAGGVLETSEAQWRRVLDVNVLGLVHCTQAWSPSMIERGEGGHVVLLSSAAAFAPMRELGAYATSKAAVLMLAECLRAELAEHAIGVSAICPGVIDTPITQHTEFAGRDEAAQAALRQRAAHAYKQRGLSPDVVAEAILRAIERNEAVVPVAVEAHLLQAAHRFVPELTRRLAKTSVL